MTHAKHTERQFMQYLRGAGWVNARALPENQRLVDSLLSKGWIEQQQQGPKNEPLLRLTEKGLEAKKSPIPTGQSKSKARAEADEKVSERRLVDPTPELSDDTRIEDVRFPTRIHNVLASAGLRTVGEVRATADRTLLSLQDLGSGSIRHLRKTLGPVVIPWR
jgi:Bacterial RNA polymerase, alpha chain C terminal domain